MNLLFLFDTNAFSDLMAGNPKLEARLAALSARDEVGMPVTARGEILFGIERLPAGRRRDNLLRHAQNRFPFAPAIPTPIGAAQEYARIKNARQRAGARMDENDVWIAATTIALNAILITRDHDFHSVPGLRTEDWTA